MTFTYHIEPTTSGFSACCEELTVEAMGATAESALEALRVALTERMVTVEAIAPPASVTPVSIVLVLATPRSHDDEPQGPGDSPAAERC